MPEGESDQQDQQQPEVQTEASSRTFSQEEVSAIMAKEKDQGQRAGARTAITKITEELGVSVEDAKKIIEAHNQRTEQEKTEAQRATEQAEAARKEAEGAKAEAARVKHDSLVERRLLKAGVPDEQLERVSKLLNTEVGGSAEDIDAEIDSLKGDLPGLFSSTAKNRAVHSDVSGGSNTTSSTDDAFTRGQKRAEERFKNRF